MVEHITRRLSASWSLSQNEVGVVKCDDSESRHGWAESGAGALDCCGVDLAGVVGHGCKVGADPRVVDTLRLAHNGLENASYHYAKEHVLTRVQS